MGKPLIIPFRWLKLYDNWGETRTGQSIVPGSPYYLNLSISADSLMQNLTAEEKEYVKLSDSISGFVCNNTAYRLAHEWSGENSPRFVFIHVPKTKYAQGKANTPNTVKLLTKMILGLEKN